MAASGSPWHLLAVAGLHSCGARVVMGPGLADGYISLGANGRNQADDDDFYGPICTGSCAYLGCDVVQHPQMAAQGRRAAAR